jgi:Mrp family chromosome partitioning ATPase
VEGKMEQPSLNLAEVVALPEGPALDPWSRLSPVQPSGRHMARHRIVTMDRANPAHMAFDMLRSKTIKLMRENRWTSLALTSPTAGCGKTTVALNLALSLSKQPDLRTVLVDLDLRRPRIAQMLGLNTSYSMEQYLRGECRLEELFVRYGDNLAIGASIDSRLHPSELLHDHKTAHVLKRLRQALRPDIVIYDLPPMLVTDDFIGFLPNVDCVLLVVGAEQSRQSEIDVCERELSDQSKLLGVALNKCRFAAAQYANYQL